jgi:hypothetical protein
MLELTALGMLCINSIPPYRAVTTLFALDLLLLTQQDQHRTSSSHKMAQGPTSIAPLSTRKPKVKQQCLERIKASAECIEG